MKSDRFSKKLRFTKETVADLNSKEMNAAHGGTNPTIGCHSRGCTETECLTQCPSILIACAGC